MNRRTFLNLSLGATSGVVMGCSSWRKEGFFAATIPKPCDPSNWKKHGVILEATEPWETGNIQNFTTRSEPLDRDRWRLWYSVSTGPKSYTIALAEGVPGEPMKKIPAQLTSGQPTDAKLAIGNLPKNWRPVQPVHIRLHDGKHRLYFWAHAPGITRYLAAESADGRRYSVIDPLRPVLYHPNDRAAFGVPSPDGIMYRSEKSVNRPAEEPLAEPHLISNDATNIYQLPDGTFEMYSVALVRVPKTDAAYIAEDNAPGLIRVIDRYTSDDGLRFENRRRVIQRDASDPTDQQFYYLAVTHTPQGRIGMLGHYRCRAQTMDLEWCYSQNGLEWQRPARSAWLPRGEPPAPDCFGIYAGSQLVQRDKRWHLFYTGVNSSHNGQQTHGKARQVIMLATTDSIWGS